MKKYPVLSMFILFLLFFSCKQEQKPKNNLPNYAQMAQEECACATETVAFNQKIQALAEAKKSEEIVEMMQEAELKAQTTKDCISKLIGKYGDQAFNSPEKMAVLQTTCPDWANMKKRSIE